MANLFKYPAFHLTQYLEMAGCFEKGLAVAEAWLAPRNPPCTSREAHSYGKHCYICGPLEARSPRYSTTTWKIKTGETRRRINRLTTVAVFWRNSVVPVSFRVTCLIGDDCWRTDSVDHLLYFFFPQFVCKYFCIISNLYFRGFIPT